MTYLTPDRETLRESLAEHFVMWHDLDGDGPRGEWRCACGAKFGFSDSAIDHQAANLPVVDAATLADDEALVSRLQVKTGLTFGVRRVLHRLPEILIERGATR